MNGWQDIRTAPVGEIVLLCNAGTGDVAAGYGEWGKAPRPHWIALDQTGVGRFKATHWMPMPKAAEAAST